MRRLFRIRFTEAGVRRDLDDEIAFHLDSRTDELIASGLSARDARERAEREFGDVQESQRELYRLDRRRLARGNREEFVTSFIEDLRYAARGLRHNRALTVVVTAVLTIGIAANAIMFGIVDQLLLRPPVGVARPGEVHRVYFRGLQDGKPYAASTTTFPAVTALRDNVRDFAGVAGHFRTSGTLAHGADAQKIDVELVSGNYFQLLGVTLERGRAFLPEEDLPPNGLPVAVVSDGFWHRQLGAHANVVGERLELNSKSFIVVGVAPPGFTSLDRENVDVWVPIASVASTLFGDGWYDRPDSWWVQAIARVPETTSMDRVLAEATATYRHEYLTWRNRGSDSTPDVALGSILGTRTPDGVSVEGRVSLWLMGVAVIVLLIACANVANLLIARMLQRRHEIAVRLALGVSRGRLLRQLLTESVLLAAIAAISAVVVSHWGARVVQHVLLPRMSWSDSALDGRVLAFTLGAALVCIVLAGCAPALQALGTSVTAALHGTGRSIAGGGGRLRGLLLVAQAALSVLLVVGAGLFVKSLRNVTGRDVGVTVDRVMLVTMNLGRAGFAPAEVDQTFDEGARRLRAIPGVVQAALVGMSVPMRSGTGLRLVLPNNARPKLEGGGPYYSVVRNDFFDALGARIRAGRQFSDDELHTPSRVMLVNELLAKTYWPGHNPVGECYKLGSDSTCTTIIGVVQNIILFSLVNDDRAMIYIPPTHPGSRDFGDGHPSAILVRTSGDPANLVTAVRAHLQGMSPRMPFVAAIPFAELVAPQLRPWRLGATMFTLFGVLALLIAAVGLYSVMAYWVAQRTHEIGVRMALGARQGDVVRLVMTQASRPILIGILLGGIAAFAASRFMTSLLYEASPHDPWVYAFAAVVLAASGLIACIAPARRSARVDPATALRAE